jgi:hypothetical protein
MSGGGIILGSLVLASHIVRTFVGMMCMFRETKHKVLALLSSTGYTYIHSSLSWQTAMHHPVKHAYYVLTQYY